MDRTTETEGRCFLRYRLTADLLCVGERMRASTYRRCLEVIPSTTLEGAFKVAFPHPDRVVYAAAKFRRPPVKEVLTYSPRDRGTNVSKLPLQVEYLTGVEADLYVIKNDWTRKFPSRFTLQVGAMRPQGFGRCDVEFVEQLAPANPKRGVLALRIPDTDAAKNAFGVRTVLDLRAGYLFVPDHGHNGHYERALFEGSRVVADPVVLEAER